MRFTKGPQARFNVRKRAGCDVLGVMVFIVFHFWSLAFVNRSSFDIAISSLDSTNAFTSFRVNVGKPFFAALFDHIIGGLNHPLIRIELFTQTKGAPMLELRLFGTRPRAVILICLI